MEWLLSMEALSAFLICFATLMIFSFLYRDNPFYKFAEHVFVGTSAGYGIVLVGVQILKPNLIDRLIPSVDKVKEKLLTAGQLSPELFETTDISLSQRLYHGEWVYYIFLVMGIMMLFKISKNYHWVSRWPLAYVIGAFAGIQIIQATQGSLIPQIHATMKDFSGGDTVEEALHASGFPPAGELDGRRQSLTGWWEGWLGNLVPENKASATATVMAGELEGRLIAHVEQPDLEGKPGETFRQARTQIHQVVSQDAELEAALCQELGGRPFNAALWLAGNPQPADSLPDWNLQLTALESKPLTVAELDQLRLSPWQEKLFQPMQRVLFESPAQRKKLAAVLTEALPRLGVVAAESVSRPEGRAGLTELLKREAFPADAQPDWSLPVSNRIADSLFSQVGNRPARFFEWKSTQLADLASRQASSPGLTVVEDLKLRLGFFDQLDSLERTRGTEAVMLFWQQGMMKEWRDTKQAWILTSLSTFTKAGWNRDFTRDQRDALRAAPAEFLPAEGEGMTVGKLRRAMLIEILSNLLVVIGVCAGVFYFFFSKKHTGALGVVSKVGIAFLMMSFGASFGYTVMGRISLAIGRFQDLLHYPLMAGTALIVLIVALAIESRGRAR
jgi:hypothetical protein